MAQELSHPFSLAFALSFAALVHHFRREGQATQERTEAMIVFSREQGFPFGSKWGYPARLGAGRAGTRRGGHHADAAGVGRLAGHGVRVIAVTFSRPASRGAWESGADRRRADVLAEALGATVNRTGETFWEAELYRLKGQLTLQ